MPNQPGQSDVALSFDRDEWELLVTLPARVLIAATSAESEPGGRTVAEGLAGIEAIAAGRGSASRLVREVVAAIYAQPDPAGQPAAEEFLDRAASIRQTLAACDRVGDSLSAKAGPADAAAYREWIFAIASAVCGAAASGGVPGMGGTRISTAESRFLDDLGAALHR